MKQQSILRVLAALILSILLWLSLGLLHGNDYSRNTHVLRALTIFLTVVPLVVLAWKFADKRPLKALAVVPTRSRLKDLVIGVIAWTVPAALGTIILVATGQVQIDVAASAIDIWQTVLLLPILVLLYEAFPEELLFRGYIYKNLEFLSKPSSIVVVQAMLFTVWGYLNGGENSLDRSLLFFSFAVMVGYIRHFTGNFWACVGFHLAFQTFAQLLGSIGGQFSVTGSNTLMLVAFILFPFALGLPMVKQLKSKPAV